MRLISIRENPEYAEKAIKYFSSKWSAPEEVYRDSITHCLTTESPLPQWYLLEKDDAIIGSTGLITNDFISRMDLYPWICGVFIEEEHRGHEYSTLLIERAKIDSAKAGFKSLYLSTDHIGFYEKFGFSYIGQGYHPWGEESRIYEISLKGVLDKPLFNIRSQRESDQSEIYHLIKKAFKTAEVSDGDEQDFALSLMKSEKYIPELALVAESEGKLIGHIMLTKTKITQSDGSSHEVLQIAPVSVLLEYRNKGVGGALIQEGFRIAKELGYIAAFLCGNPNYYHRFGFRSTVEFGIVPENNIPPQFVMGYELEPGALDHMQGTLVIS